VPLGKRPLSGGSAQRVVALTMEDMGSKEKRIWVLQASTALARAESSCAPLGRRWLSEVYEQQAIVLTVDRGDLRACQAITDALGRRSIPPGGVASPSNTPGMLGRRAWPAGRLDAPKASVIS